MSLICFNLDGTVVDPTRAMEHCARLACADLGLAAPSRERVAQAVGGTPDALFADLAGAADPARLEQILARYWQHFADTGIVRHRVYQGIALMLSRLKHQGHELYAVTAKPLRYAKQVLHQFDLLLAFGDIAGGAERPPWPSKAEVVAQLRERGSLKGGGYLVGDRADDMQAARANGLTPLGVTYGFGSAAELLDAGAKTLFPSVTSLDDWFKETLQQPEILDSFSRSE